MKVRTEFRFAKDLNLKIQDKLSADVTTNMSRTILVLGAGRSSSALIAYLKDYHAVSGTRVIVGDLSFAYEEEHPWGKNIPFDIREREGSTNAIRSADVVISMMPAHLHPPVAQICLREKKHLLTASYVSDEMKALDAVARNHDLLFLNECGLDPGIDHMSAMQVIDRIAGEGGKMISFESFTGGLIAPDTDPENPWRYKFTWNPRNVVVAGQGTSRFMHQGQFKYIPYQQLFKRITPVSIPGSGEYEGYANRDSLKYIEAYGLQTVQTMLRGTLRCKGYCSAWNVLVQLGCTDDSFQMSGVAGMTHRSFIESFVEGIPGQHVEYRLAEMLGLKVGGEELRKLRWSGFFDDEPVGLTTGSPARITEHILNKKWKLHPLDKDLVVMWHRFGYELRGAKHEIQSSLVVTGENSVDTAMARTVGLPLAIAARLLLEGKIKSRGVVIPTTREYYEPILGELGRFGVKVEDRIMNNEQ